MRYDSPELRERLAAEYVLGTMPSRSRRRFERLMAADPELARAVGAWADRLSPLDAPTPPVAPPARVWRAIERRTGGPAAAPQPLFGWLDALAWWRGLALAASAAAVALALYVAAGSGPTPAPTVVAVLTGRGGEAGWVAVAGPTNGEVSISAVAPKAGDQTRAFELWGIADGAPRPLGLLPRQSGGAVRLRAAQLPAPGGVLAVSLEPPGGSPTGLPTGPVVYQGKVLAHAP